MSSDPLQKDIEAVLGPSPQKARGSQFHGLYDQLDSAFKSRFGRSLFVTGSDTAEHARLHPGGARDVRAHDMTGDERRFVLDTARGLGMNVRDYSWVKKPTRTSTGVLLTGPHIHLDADARRPASPSSASGSMDTDVRAVLSGASSKLASGDQLDSDVQSLLSSPSSTTPPQKAMVDRSAPSAASPQAASSDHPLYSAALNEVMQATGVGEAKAREFLNSKPGKRSYPNLQLSSYTPGSIPNVEPVTRELLPEDTSNIQMAGRINAPSGASPQAASTDLVDQPSQVPAIVATVKPQASTDKMIVVTGLDQKKSTPEDIKQRVLEQIGFSPEDARSTPFEIRTPEPEKHINSSTGELSFFIPKDEYALLQKQAQESKRKQAAAGVPQAQAILDQADISPADKARIQAVLDKYQQPAQQPQAPTPPVAVRPEDAGANALIRALHDPNATKEAPPWLAALHEGTGNAAAYGLDAVSRPFTAASTSIAGLQRAIGAQIAAWGGDPEAKKVLDEYGGANIFKAAWHALTTGEVPKGYEQPVAMVVQELAQRGGVDPESELGQTIFHTTGGVFDPVSYGGADLLAGEGVNALKNLRKPGASIAKEIAESDLANALKSKASGKPSSPSPDQASVDANRGAPLDIITEGEATRSREQPSVEHQFVGAGDVEPMTNNQKPLTKDHKFITSEEVKPSDNQNANAENLRREGAASSQEKPGKATAPAKQEEVVAQAETPAPLVKSGDAAVSPETASADLQTQFDQARARLDEMNARRRAGENVKDELAAQIKLTGDLANELKAAKPGKSKAANIEGARADADRIIADRKIPGVSDLMRDHNLSYEQARQIIGDAATKANKTRTSARDFDKLFAEVNAEKKSGVGDQESGAEPINAPEASPEVASMAEAKPTRTVSVNDKQVTLTESQAAAWDEAQQRYQDKLAHAKSIETVSRDPERAGKMRKQAGFELAAEKRQITGQLTAKEQAAKNAHESSSYVGKSVNVEVDGKSVKGTVQGNPFGRVKVALEDGRTITVEKDRVTTAASPDSTSSAKGEENISPYAAKSMDDLLTPKQLNAIFVISSEKGLPIEELARARYQLRPDELNKKTASNFIDELKKAEDQRFTRQPVSPPEPAPIPAKGESVTDKQLGAIYTTAKHRSLDPQVESQALFKADPEQLTTKQASTLIDHLKNRPLRAEPPRVSPEKPGAQNGRGSVSPPDTPGESGAPSSGESAAGVKAQDVSESARRAQIYERMRKRGERERGSGGPGAEDRADMVELAASYVREGTAGFNKWKAELQNELGLRYEAVKPHLMEAWDAARQAIASESKDQRKAAIQKELPAAAEPHQSVTTKDVPADARRPAFQKALPAESVDLSKATPPGKMKVEPLIEDVAKPPKRSHPLEVLSAFRKAGLLSGIKTHLKNIGSNALMQVMENGTTRAMGSIADIAMSAITKQRTFTGVSLRAEAKAGYEAATRGVKEAVGILKKGAPEAELEKLANTREINSGSKILDIYINGSFRLLGAEDRVFRVYAYRRSLEDRALAMAKTEARAGKLKVSTKERAKQIVKETQAGKREDLAAQALSDAEIATFNNSNLFGDMVQAAKTKAEEYGHTGQVAKAAVDFTLPFATVPANVVARTLDYAGVGVAKETVKAIIKRSFTPEQQRAFAQQFGRAATGVPLIALGWHLYLKGLMTGILEDTTGERGMDEAAGRPPGAIRVDGKWRQVMNLSPLGTLLTLGATLAEEHTRELTGKQTRAGQMLKRGAEATIFTHPLAETTKEMGQGLARGDFSRTVNSAAGSIIPTVVADIAQAGDTKARKVDGPLDAIAARVPGWRNTLPVKRDAFGREIEQPRISAVDPFRSSKAKEQSDPVIGEMMRVGAGISKEKEAEGKDLPARGEKVYNAIKILILSSAYKKAPDHGTDEKPGKREMLEKQISKIRAAETRKTNPKKSGGLSISDIFN